MGTISSVPQRISENFVHLISFQHLISEKGYGHDGQSLSSRGKSTEGIKPLYYL
jgi:hypothetical protein